MNRIKKNIQAIALPFIVLLTFASSLTASPQHDKDDIYNQIELLSDVITAIEHDYVESVTPKNIIYGALKGMLSSLDPYSQFMDPDMFKELQVETEGHFGGLGIEITIRDNLLTIISPLDGTPAEKAGLKAQDRIVKIEDKITRDMTLSEAVKLMRGPVGTKVTITIMREKEEELKEYTITRDIINIKSIRKSEILGKDIGYIKLTDFSETTKSDMANALQNLEKTGIEGLILDLRNNPGGLLTSSVEIASEFLPTGELVVYTKGREKSQNTEYRATGKTNFKDIPLIVLINSGSASASEIVAGAIQDHKRGIIVGTKSFGKGSVQTVIPLKDGSALRLTTAVYYTPSGRTINEKGIIPDVVVEFEEKQLIQKAKNEKKEQEDIFDKLKEETENTETQDKTHEEMLQKDPNIEDQNQQMIENDSQLRAAINIMHGIKIYKSIKKIN
ncbi:MAG: S41 family peptidase [Candidatus Omnitrophica bacterium]|nr:S41 family peptidase [Candidatus Omnitrophota bacterium]